MLTKLFKNLWLQFLSPDNKNQMTLILPTPYLLAYLAITTCLIVIAEQVGLGWLLFWVGYGVLIVLSGIELLLILPSKKTISVERTIPEEIEHLQPFTVSVQVKNSGIGNFF